MLSGQAEVSLAFQYTSVVTDKDAAAETANIARPDAIRSTLTIEK
jgi:hypothetical protein